MTVSAPILPTDLKRYMNESRGGDSPLLVWDALASRWGSVTLKTGRAQRMVISSLPYPAYWRVNIMMALVLGPIWGILIYSTFVAGKAAADATGLIR